MRRSPNTMRVAGAAMLPSYVAEQGGLPERVLRDAGLVAAELRQPQAWIDVERLGALYEAAARELDDPNLGLHFGRAIPLHAYGLLSYVVLNAPTVHTALKNLARFANHLSGAWAASLVDDGPEARLVFAYETSHRPDQHRQYIESVAGVLCVMMKTLAGADWTPTEVRFQHRIGDARRQPERLLQAPVYFGRSTNEIVFGGRTLDATVLTADRTLLPVFEKQVVEVIAEAAGGDAPSRLLAAVRDEVARGLCDGHPSLQRIARSLAMSARTLQRELQREGVRFKTLVNDTRLRIAQEYLTRPELSITEVAFLLGYADLSAFDRAFRRAAGTSPRAWRAGQGRTRLEAGTSARPR